jgi:maleylpyruvate isomerase
VTVSRSAKGGGPALAIAATDTGGRWDIAGSGAPVPVTGALPDLAAYLTGRPAPALATAPVLPPWL